MNIHYLQHVAFEGPGFLEQWALDHQHTLNATKFFEEGFSYPEVSAIDVLIILGGPMSIYDDQVYPWLVGEKSYIKEAIDAGKKVLGICLGAQLIANVLGAAVKPALNKEIGWFPVYPTEEAAQVSWFQTLFADQPYALHWHADKFEIPFGAINLASTDGNKNQAFIVGENVLALQFHFEATHDSLEGLIIYSAADLAPGNYVQVADELRQAGSVHMLVANKHMEGLLHAFLA